MSGAGKASSASVKSAGKKAVKATGAGSQAKAKNPAPKKKKSTKTNTPLSTAAIMSDAKTAAADLEKQRAKAVARQSDPLWYKVEDFSSLGATPMVSQHEILPEQVQLVEKALGHCGLARSDVTPQAFACLMEQARRFACELIEDAHDYSVSRSEIFRNDLLLAAELRGDQPLAISSELPKLNLVAQEINRVPLPPIPSHCYSGIVLPPKQHQLTARTFDVISAVQVARRVVQPPPSAPAKEDSKVSTYGASKGRQIPVNLKTASAAGGGPASSGPTPMEISSVLPTSGGATGTATTNPHMNPVLPRAP